MGFNSQGFIIVASCHFHYVNSMTLWPVGPQRPLNLHNGWLLGHYLYINIVILLLNCFVLTHIFRHTYTLSYAMSPGCGVWQAKEPEGR